MFSNCLVVKENSVGSASSRVTQDVPLVKFFFCRRSVVIAVHTIYNTDDDSRSVGLPVRLLRQLQAISAAASAPLPEICGRAAPLFN